MKKTLQNIGIYLLILSTLTASIGIPLHKRSCRMPDMDDQVRVFVQPNSCCDHQKEPHCDSESKSIPLNPCCEFSSEFLKIDVQVKQLLDFTWEFSLGWWYVISSPKDISFLSIILLHNRIDYADTSPPFLSGREHLLKKQLLLI